MDPADADAMAAATAEAMEELKAQAQALSKFAPEILKSFLEGASWGEAFDEFFRANCAQFAGFVVGEEYSLLQTDVHITFVKTAESLLDAQLGEMAITADRFLEQTLSDLKNAPTGSPAAQAAGAVMERLEECADFERFGVMMRRRHEALQSGQGDEATDEDEDEDEDAEFLREQAAIKEATQRRRQARDAAAESMRRELDAEETATAASAEADAEATRQERVSAMEASAEPELEPEPEPDQTWSASQQAATIQSLVQNDDVASIGSELLELQKLQDTEWTTVGAGKGNTWEVGATHKGVVSYWNQAAGWGKIKRTDGAALKLHPKRPPRRGWKNEIFVHNTQLPMDAKRRWLKRGEQVQFKVGVGAKGKGPQALGVIGLDEDGVVVQLLCQLHANPPAFKAGFLDGGKKKKQRGGKRRAD